MRPPHPSFAEAQVRLASRRQAREAEHQARVSAQRSRTSTAHARIENLPFPLRLAGLAGLNAYNGVVQGTGLSDSSRPAFRVGQVDSELLDDELLDLLRNQVRDAFKYVSGGHISDDWAPEIALLIRAALFKLSVWDRDATYGASLQNLRFIDARSRSLSTKPPTDGQKTAYGLVTVVGSYAWTKWENWLLDNEASLDRRPILRRIATLTDKFTSVHAVASLISFLIFLRHGTYRTILDRLLRMKLAPRTTQVVRDISLEYQNRQLVWHAFTEFLLFLLPLVGINRWWRLLGRIWNRTKALVTNAVVGDDSEEGIDDEKKGELAFLPEKTCPVCYQEKNAAATEEEAMAAAAGGGGVMGSSQTDVCNAYQALPCGCVYCFACLSRRLEQAEGEGWTCLRCGKLIQRCRVWNGDVFRHTEPTRRKSHGGKSVEFSDNVKMFEAKPYYSASEEGKNDQDDQEEGGEGELQVVEPVAATESVSDTESEGYEEEEDEIGEDLGEVEGI